VIAPTPIEPTIQAAIARMRAQIQAASSEPSATAVSASIA